MREAMIGAWSVEERREEIVREVRTNRLVKKSRKNLYAQAFVRELKLDFVRLVEALARREKKKGASS